MVLLKITCRDRDVIEQTKPQCRVMLRMMAGRADEREGVVCLAGCNGICEREDSTCRKQGDIKRLLGDRDVWTIKVRQSVFAARLRAGNEFMIMNPVQPLKITGGSGFSIERRKPVLTLQVLQGV